MIGLFYLSYVSHSLFINNNNNNNNNNNIIIIIIIIIINIISGYVLFHGKQKLTARDANGLHEEKFGNEGSAAD